MCLEERYIESLQGDETYSECASVSVCGERERERG